MPGADASPGWWTRTVGNRAKSSPAVHERSESPLVRSIVLDASEPLQTTVEHAVLSKTARHARQRAAPKAAMLQAGQQSRGPHGYVYFRVSAAGHGHSILLRSIYNRLRSVVKRASN